MFWLIVIGVVCYCAYRVYSESQYKEPSASEEIFSTSASSSVASTHKTFSNDIYKAIEEFARLCHQCKQTTGWAYERDFATILVTHTAQSTKLELTCRGDSIACTLPAEFKWLRNDSDLNELRYEANNVSGYVKENYGSSKPTEADSLFYFYKQGDPHAIGVSLWQKDEGNIVGMHIDLR